MPNDNSHFDVCLSFAGEDREYVERVAAALHNAGVNLFYDRYEQVSLWGRDLYQHLDDVYRRRATYCVVFISRAYSQKLWTRHELKIIQARAFEENREYILPVRLDDTQLPGVLPTTGYISGKSAKQLAELIIEKLRQTDGSRPVTIESEPPETSPIESAVRTGLRLHVDNTLVHGIVRCLEGRAKEVDVAGLLGLANFLVFADTIVFGHQELDSVRETSERFIRELHELHLEPHAIDHVTVSRESFESACRLAAERLGPQIEASLQGFRSHLHDEGVSFRPEGVEVDVLRYQRVHDLIARAPEWEKELVDVAKQAIAERRSVGAFEYAIGVDDVLREALRKGFIDHPWSVDLTEKMAILFRIHLNHVLASRQEALHAPAPARMRLLRHLISTVSLEFEDNLRHLDLLVPDVARFIANISGGNPRPVLAAAIELRAQAIPIRAKLRSLACDLITGQDSESRRDFRAEARRLVAGQTERSEPDRWGLKLILLAHIASMRFGFNLQMDWWRKGPVVALSHDSVFFNAGDPDFRTLIQNSCGNQ